MRHDAAVTLDHVRQVSDDLAVALRRRGADNAADTLAGAAADDRRAPHEALLELRSALVRTRSEWEVIDDVDLVNRARSTLSSAKRLALDL